MRLPVPVADLESKVVDERGRIFAVRVFGVEADDGLWDGFVEFAANDGEVRVTPRETRQPSLPDLVYWATGLGRVYLEGALARAEQGAEPDAAEGRRRVARAGGRRRTPTAL